MKPEQKRPGFIPYTFSFISDAELPAAVKKIAMFFQENYFSNLHSVFFFSATI
jgi:hypothetical protein